MANTDMIRERAAADLKAAKDFLRMSRSPRRSATYRAIAAKLIVLRMDSYRRHLKLAADLEREG
jgi:hypothetical protein